MLEGLILTVTANGPNSGLDEFVEQGVYGGQKIEWNWLDESTVSACGLSEIQVACIEHEVSMHNLRMKYPVLQVHV